MNQNGLKLNLRDYERLPCADREQATSPGEGWAYQWHGYYLPASSVEPYWNSGHMQQWAFLSLMDYYGGQHINLFELGAGQGNWCMALAGVIRYGLVENPPVSYRALAIEAEPVHFRWLKEAVETQDLNVVTIEGAINKENGPVHFITGMDPQAYFGQHITAVSDVRGASEVMGYTLDYLRKEYDFEYIQIVHMDVQDAEADVVRGAKDSLPRIEHFLIETHTTRVEGELRQLLGPTHRIILDLPRFKRMQVPGFTRPSVGRGGGMQLWQRKGL